MRTTTLGALCLGPAVLLPATGCYESESEKWVASMKIIEARQQDHMNMIVRLARHGRTVAVSAVAAASGAAAASTAYLGADARAAEALDTVRLNTKDPRMSQVVIHKPSRTVYLSGITGAEAGDTCALQTQCVLDKIDERLALAGSSKSHLLNCTIWLADINSDFKEMNATWNAWVDPDSKPARSTVQSPMARPVVLVEIQATAALPPAAA